MDNAGPDPRASGLIPRQLHAVPRSGVSFSSLFHHPGPWRL